MISDADSAHVRIPPPLIFLVCLLLGIVIHRLYPIAFLPENLVWWPALLLIGAGLGLLGHCAWAFKKRNTNILPWKATHALVITGAYRFTRNPMYLAFLLVGAGVAAAANNAWMLVTLFLFSQIVQRTAISKEERYLQEKFGQAYADYRKSVRRWI